MSDKKFLVIVVAVAIVVIVGVVVFKDRLQAPPPQLLGQEYAEEGRNHLQPGEQAPTYKTNPPVSGSHDPEPAEWGFYDQELLDTKAIHTLEHGGIWVSYQPDALNGEEIEQLRKLAKKYDRRLIISPRAQNDSKVAVASWQHLEKLENLDLELINQFLTTNVNQSPEKVAR